MGGKEGTAVEIIGSAFGSDLNLGSGKSAILSVIVVGNYFYIADGIFRRGNHCSAAPDGARRADAVDRHAGVLSLVAIGITLDEVFSPKDPSRSTRGRGCTLCAGKGVFAPPRLANHR